VNKKKLGDNVEPGVGLNSASTILRGAGTRGLLDRGQNQKRMCILETRRSCPKNSFKGVKRVDGGKGERSQNNTREVGGQGALRAREPFPTLKGRLRHESPQRKELGQNRGDIEYDAAKTRLEKS